MGGPIPLHTVENSATTGATSGTHTHYHQWLAHLFSASLRKVLSCGQARAQQACSGLGCVFAPLLLRAPCAHVQKNCLLSVETFLWAINLLCHDGFLCFALMRALILSRFEHCCIWFAVGARFSSIKLNDPRTQRGKCLGRGNPERRAGVHIAFWSSPVSRTSTPASRRCKRSGAGKAP